MSEIKFTPQEITDNLARLFGAPLIISAIGWVLYGVNLCQYFQYLMVFAKRDHIFTRIWLSLTMLMLTASLFYQVYFDWTYSIIVFTESIEQSSIANGSSVALYSSVILLTQLFWLACIKRMMVSQPKVARITIIAIGLVSLASFVLAITVGALSNGVANEDGSWPNGTISIILRVLLGLDVGVDVAILAVVLSQLLVMRKSSGSIKKTVSKLSYTLLAITLLCAIVMITELVINFPHLGRHGTIHITITFAPIISNFYAFGVTAVLNARTDLWATRRLAPQESEFKGLIPGLNFSVDLPPEKETGIDALSGEVPLSNLSIEHSSQNQNNHAEM